VSVTCPVTCDTDGERPLALALARRDRAGGGGSAGRQPSQRSDVDAHQRHSGIVARPPPASSTAAGRAGAMPQ